MNTVEKAKYVQNLNDYMEKKRVYPILEDLYKQLLLEKPADPITHLITHLKEGGSRLNRKTYLYHWSSRFQNKTAQSSTK